METIKVADVYVKFRPDEVHLELPIGCNQCAFDKQQAIQLAAALTERYGGGEWLTTIQHLALRSLSMEQFGLLRDWINSYEKLPAP